MIGLERPTALLRAHASNLVKGIAGRSFDVLKLVPRAFSAMLLAGLGSVFLAQAANAAIAYVQGTYNSPLTSVSSITANFANAQNAGDLNVVAISWESTTGTVQSVTDTSGNTYALAAGPTSFNIATQSIYYAKNVAAAAAGANTITVTFAAAVPHPDLRIAEYSGINTAAPLDVAVSGSGSSTSMTSGSATTTNANDLLVGANVVAHSTTGPGTGYTQRLLSTHDDIFEDKIVTATGSYSATAPQDTSGWYVMQMVAFKAAAGDTQAPSVPTNPALSVRSSSLITLNWVASTDNVGVTGYRVERCSGASCSSFAQVGTPSTNAYVDPGLTATTSYSYRVRATDAAGNLSTYSSTVSGTTQAAGSTTSTDYYYDSAGRLQRVDWWSGQTTTYKLDAAGNRLTVNDSDGSKPTSPTTLSGTAASPTQVNLTWTKSTDNVAVTGYLVERCAPVGSSCDYSPVGSVSGNPASPAYSDITGVSYTAYKYRIRAQDGNGNLSDPSNVLSITTLDGTPPSGFGPVSVASATASQVVLQWSTNANDNVAVTGYAFERCTGNLCTSGFSPVGTSAGSPFTDTSVAQITTYGYRGRAFDARTNYGPYTNPVYVTTLDGTAPSTPSTLTTTQISSTQIKLDWGLSTDNVGVTGYKLERCAGTTCTPAEFYTLTGSPPAVTFTDGGLSPATTYRYRVRAVDAAGNLSGYSPITAGTTASGAPSAPTLTPANLQTTNHTLTLTWSTPSGATSYNLYNSPDGVDWTNTTPIYTGTANAYTFTTGNGDHYYQVKACNSTACSAFSNPAHILVCPVSGCL